MLKKSKRRSYSTYWTKVSYQDLYLHANGTIDDRIARIIERKRLLTDEHIGTEDVTDAPEDVVMDLIKWWSSNAEAPVGKGESMLGIAKALPAYRVHKMHARLSLPGNVGTKHRSKHGQT